jgi:hypothetical protein
MRLHARTIIAALLLTPALAACGGDKKEGNVVQMKDMEVVDGTATDAMTDLDGVQSESATAELPGNATDGAAKSPAGNAAAPKEADDAEVVADQ